MKRLACKVVSEQLLERLKKETELFIEKENRAPGLAVVLVGEDPASITYVRNKSLKAEELGFVHFQYNLDRDCEENDVLNLIDRLNHDDSVDGILVQLPLPGQIDEDKVINAISADKDADGFSQINVGKMCIGQESVCPCTPAGIMEILSFYGVDTIGKRVVVIGRSNTVGKPMAMMLMQRGVDATVTVCNTKTPDLKAYTNEADIIIVATGHPGTIDSTYVKDGAVVIDVGMNRIPDASREKGFRLVGDADYQSFKDRDVAITPVPGGVGLMTVAMLMSNTLKLAKMRVGKK